METKLSVFMSFLRGLLFCHLRSRLDVFLIPGGYPEQGTDIG